MSRHKNTTPLPILSGWKDIANHLGKCVRTVQRYELEAGLPIRRPAGKSRGSVIATMAELDAWINAIPLRGSFGLRRELLNSADTLAGFKKVLQEHHRLLEEMERLRREMQTARVLLRENLGVMQAERSMSPHLAVAS